MNAISSTCEATFGKMSDTSMPDCPYFLNPNGLGISGPGCPWRTTRSSLIIPSSGCPAYRVSAALGSKVSTWLTPPLMKREITAFARGLKCGAFGAYGLDPIGAAPQALDASGPAAARRPSPLNKYASARPLTPPPERNRNSRRDQQVVHRCMALT